MIEAHVKENSNFFPMVPNMFILIRVATTPGNSWNSFYSWKNTPGFWFNLLENSWKKYSRGHRKQWNIYLNIILLEEIKRKYNSPGKLNLILFSQWLPCLMPFESCSYYVWNFHTQNSQKVLTLKVEYCLSILEVFEDDNRSFR